MAEDRTNAERQRRYIERLKARAAGAVTNAAAAGVAALRAENTSLKKRLAQAEARVAEMAANAARAPTGGVARTSAPRRDSEDAPRRIRKGDIEAYQIELGRTRELLAKAEAKLATTPPAERDRLVERLKTENRNLKLQVRVMVKDCEERDAQLDKRERKLVALFNVVIPCLHSDTRNHMTAKQLDHACGLLTEWKTDKDKARRKVS